MKRILLVVVLFLAIGMLMATASLPRDRYGLTMQFEEDFTAYSDSVTTALDSIQVPVNTTSAYIWTNVITRVRGQATTTTTGMSTGFVLLPAGAVVKVPVINRGYIVYQAIGTAGRFSIIWCKMP